jgi:hypothetical protein
MDIISQGNDVRNSADVFAIEFLQSETSELLKSLPRARLCGFGQWDNMGGIGREPHITRIPFHRLGGI